MFYHNTFYLPTQNSSSYSSNFCSEDDINTMSSPIIASLPAIKHNHNSASTAILIPSSLEYENKFYSPTQDSSSVSSISSCSDDYVVIQNTNTTKKTVKDAFYIHQIHYVHFLLLTLCHLSISKSKKFLKGKYYIFLYFTLFSSLSIVHSSYFYPNKMQPSIIFFLLLKFPCFHLFFFKERITICQIAYVFCCDKRYFSVLNFFVTYCSSNLFFQKILHGCKT